MSLVNEYGPPAVRKTMPVGANGNLISGTALAEAAATGYLYFAGPWFWDPSIGATFVARRAGFMFGTPVTKTNGSTLTVALQAVNLTAGPPVQPDGVDLVTAAIANADAAYAATTWYRTADFGANTTLSAQGALLAVVIRYNSFQAGDTLKLNLCTSIQGGSSADQFGTAVAGKYIASAFGIESHLPNVVLEDASGNFATLLGCTPFSEAYTSVVQNTGTGAGTGTRIALPLTVPSPRLLAGLNVYMFAAAGADYDVKLRLASDDSVLATMSQDSNAIAANTILRWAPHLFATPYALVAGTAYRVTVEPTTANSVSTAYLTVASANHLQCYPGGSACNYQAYVNSAWAAAVTTRRILIEPIFGQYDDGAGGTGAPRPTGSAVGPSGLIG